MLSEHYFSSRELMYSGDLKNRLSRYEYDEFLKYKQGLIESKNDFIRKPSLKTFNNAPIHFARAFDLVSSVKIYLKAVLEDLAQNNFSTMFSRNVNDITLSRIYSEIEGSLNIESVPTTRKVVDELAKGKRIPQDKNDQIIKNMLDAIKFVNQAPEFNDDNLFALYNILSNGCLDDEDKLLNGNHYRHDQVEVGGYTGCPVNQIKECMDSLFDFVNHNMKNPEFINFLPHIAHYYIAYVHPYFDYNGRTARMVSYWVSILLNKDIIPPVVSEAINQTKSKYYEALSESRDANNDLTYFFIYIFDISTRYCFAYRNIEDISQELMNKKSIVLSASEKSYFKKILISNKGKFTHNEFTQWIGVNMSKQGALKVLNAFEEYGLLTSETSKSNNKLFEINKNMIKYRI